MRMKYLAAAITFTLAPMLVVPQVIAGVNVFLDESTLVNDLQGSLAGSVKFAQTHTIDAANNAKKEMPRLTSTRDTLVMLIPSGASVKSMTVTARKKNGELLGTLNMRTPNELPHADRPNNSPNPDVVYSDKAWSNVLPANWVQPGMTLEFVTSDQRSGKLTGLDIGGETQVVLQNIRIGMLTPPGSLNKNPLEKESQKLAEDYYQKIPVSELIVGNYSPIELNEVILSSGKKYTASSDDNGTVYNGDMRKNIARGIISTGINNANFGVNSSKGEEPWQAGLFHQVAVHQSWGRYRNGVVQHGRSAGHGLATILDTFGNEFSHEIGHGFGIGDYPGGGRWYIHNRESGWGWDNIQNRFIANFFWDRGGNTPAEGAGDTHVTPPFLGIYKFNRDTMGGGGASSPLSQYTLHTGYTQKRIQQWLEAKAVIAPHSDSGYLIWNEQQKKMVKPQGALYRKPAAFGMPVVTLVGYYDTQDVLESYIYPALYGSYGYTYKPEPLKNGQCWAEVVYANGSAEKFGLTGYRLQAGHMNKFHINVPESKKPESVQIACPHRDTEAVFTRWALKKFGVNKFYDWEDKNEALGSIYYYPKHEFYVRLKSKPFGYFPITPVDNSHWTYLSDKTLLWSEYQKQPMLPSNEHVLTERLIGAVFVSPQPAAKVGHLYMDNEVGNQVPTVNLDRTAIDVVGTSDWSWGYQVTGTSNQSNITWKWEHVEGSKNINLKSYDKATTEVTVPKNLYDASAKFRLTATNSDKKTGEAFVTINVAKPAVSITGPNSMNSTHPVKLQAEANFEDSSYHWLLKQGTQEIANGIDGYGQIKSGLRGSDYTAEVTAKSTLGARSATNKHSVKITEEAHNNDQAFVSSLTLAMQPTDNGNNVRFSGAVKSSTTSTTTPAYLWTLPSVAQDGSNGQIQQSFSVSKSGQVQNLTVKVKVTAGKVSRELEQKIVVPATSGGGDTHADWVYGTNYKTGEVVKHKGKLFECVVAGWCSQTGEWSQLHYEPGVGLNWAHAWKARTK